MAADGGAVVVELPVVAVSVGLAEPVAVVDERHAAALPAVVAVA